jgi:hypothetical protein
MDKPEFVKLTNRERSRTYHFQGHKLTVLDVVAVCVRPSGTHRLETADGRKWIVAAGWNAIEIDVDEWTF